MKKILFIIPFIPYPLTSGGNQAFFNMVEYIRHKMSVSLLLCPKSKEQKRDIEELKSKWDNVTFHIFIPSNTDDSNKSLYYKYLKKIKASVTRKINRLQRRSNLHKGESFDLVRAKSILRGSFYREYDAEYLDYVANISQKGFDIIQVEFYGLIALGYLLPKNTQTIFVHHELGYIRNEEEISLYKKVSNEERMIFHIAKDFERGALLSYNHIITLTEVDKSLLDNFLDHKKTIHVSPAVVQFSHNKIINYNAVTNHRLTFVGSEAHFPNLDAVDWFCREIAPLLRKQGITFTFQVIGRWKGKYIKQLKKICPELQLLGYIEDLHTALNGSIFLVPIRIGSGMRMKILDAINSKSPLITTTKGVEGLNFINEEECLIADTPDAFANAIIRLLNDTNLQKKLALQAATKLQEQYKPEKMLERRMAIYDSILA